MNYQAISYYYVTVSVARSKLSTCLSKKVIIVIVFSVVEKENPKNIIMFISGEKPKTQKVAAVHEIVIVLVAVMASSVSCFQPTQAEGHSPV